MDAGSRRKRIMEIFSTSATPVTGGELSVQLDVTRQVVVQDVALLRAGGAPIIATISGYLLIDTVPKSSALRVFSCCHQTLEQAETELMIMVQNGGTVRDIIIEHPVYGEISAAMLVRTPEEVKSLIDLLSRKNSKMLSSTTNGAHMHTVEAAREEILDEIESRLRAAGILL